MSWCVQRQGQSYALSGINNRREELMVLSAKAFSYASLAAVVSIAAFATQPASAQSAATTFFVTSNGPGNGGNLGGLAGAGAPCQALAQGAGAGGQDRHGLAST